MGLKRVKIYLSSIFSTELLMNRVLLHVVSKEQHLLPVQVICTSVYQPAIGWKLTIEAIAVGVDFWRV